MPDIRSGPPAALVAALTAAYIVLAGVPELFPLRVVGRGAQAGDLIGVVLVAGALWQLAAARRLPSAAATDRASLAWLVAVAAAGVAGVARGTLPAATAVRELAVVLSLVGVYAALRVLAPSAGIAASMRALAWMAVLGSAAGLAGMSLSFFGLDTPLVLPGTTPYPYAGTTARAQGWTSSPNMLASVAVTGGLAWTMLAVRDRRWRRRSGWMAAVIGAGVLLPLSKSAACLVAGLLLATAASDYGRRAGVKAAAAAFGVAAAVAYLVLSHVTITSPASVDRLVAGRFIAGAPLATVHVAGDTLGVYRTNYWFNKAASIAAIEQHFPWGLGPGGQNAFTAARMRAGRHPATLWAADPHSTYTGTAAELGLLGLAGLAAMAWALALDLRRAGRRGWLDDPRVATLAVAAAIYVALEAVTIDVMNFRHYWVAAALLASASGIPASGCGSDVPAVAHRADGAPGPS